MRASSTKEDKRNRKIESKTERDLKNLIDQGLSNTSNRPISNQNQNPLDRFFQDEKRTTTKLLKIIQSDVEHLSLEDVKVPKRWISEWPSGPLEIIPFVNRLISRHQSLNALSSSLPRGVNLFWFARPRAFLAAFKQYTARESGHPLENLRLRANWSETSVAEEWKTSIIVEGLLLTGKS